MADSKVYHLLRECEFIENLPVIIIHLYILSMRRVLHHCRAANLFCNPYLLENIFAVE